MRRRTSSGRRLTLSGSDRTLRLRARALPRRLIHVRRRGRATTAAPHPKGSMYAVIETGGKQYRVEVGTELEVELLDGRARRQHHARPRPARRRRRRIRDRTPDRRRCGRRGRGRSPRPRREAHLVQVPARRRARRVKKGHRQELMVLRITDVRLGKQERGRGQAQGRCGREDRARAPPGGRRQAGRRGRRPRREAARRRRPPRRRRKAPAEGRARRHGRRRPRRPPSPPRRPTPSPTRRPSRRPRAPRPRAARPTPSRATPSRRRKPRATKKDE